jgi:hypothetical protein
METPKLSVFVNVSLPIQTLSAFVLKLWVRKFGGASDLSLDFELLAFGIIILVRFCDFSGQNRNFTPVAPAT